VLSPLELVLLLLSLSYSGAVRDGYCFRTLGGRGGGCTLRGFGAPQWPQGAVQARMVCDVSPQLLHGPLVLCFFRVDADIPGTG